MKKTLSICILIAAYIVIILSLLIPTKVLWLGLGIFLIGTYDIMEQFSVDSEQNRIKKARILIPIDLLLCTAGLLVFIKSILR